MAVPAYPLTMTAVLTSGRNLFRLPVLDRYLVREVLRAAVAVTVVLMLLIASKLLMQQLGYLLEGKFTSGIVTELLFNKLIAYFVHLLPFMVLLSTVLILGRMHRDSEVVALYACGYSLTRMLRPMALVAVPLALALGWASLVAVPKLALDAELAHHQARIKAGLDVGHEGRFLQAQGGSWILYAARAQDDLAEDVFFAVYEKESDQIHIETAARARRGLDEQKQHFVLSFEDGRRYSGWPGASDFDTLNFKQHVLRIDASAPATVHQKTRYQTLAQLWASDSSQAAGELQWRLSLPLSLLLMMALAVPLARSSLREGKYAYTAYAILIYLLYAQMQLLTTSQVRAGAWPAWAGVWWVHVLMGLIIFRLYGGARGLASTARALMGLIISRLYGGYARWRL